MRRATIVLFVTMLFAAGMSAQKSSAPFLRIGSAVATYGEFEHMYKLNSSSALVPISKSDYVELFVNYKLKVAEARSLEMDTAQAYHDECEYYVGELAQSYLTDTLAQSRFEQRLRSRLREEVNGQHILVSCPPNASPTDTANAYKRILLARQRVVDGESFEAVASQMSEDPSARINNGNLGWFSAMQMVEPFEDAAYSTAIGQCSPVFRTRFGYHFMRVVDRRKAEGEVLLRHLLLATPYDLSDAQQAEAKRLADSLSTALRQHPDDFPLAAAKYSDERNSAARGGLITWCMRAQIPEPIAEVAFTMEKGAVSEPIRTQYGWHIVQLVDKRAEKPAEEFHAMVSRLFDVSPIYKDAPAREKMKELAAQYKFAWQQPGRDSLTSICLGVSNPLERAERLRKLQLPLATSTARNFSLADAAEYSNQWQADRLPQENLTALRDGLLRDYEMAALDKKFDDFHYMKTEYVEGLLVFDYMQQYVWSQQPDSSQIAAIYAGNPRRYANGGTFEGTLLFCSSPAVAAKAAALFDAGKAAKAAKLADKVVMGRQEQGDAYDDVLWPATGEVNSSAVVRGTFTEGEPASASAKAAMIVGDYQAQKERETLAALRAKFKPVVLLKVK